MRVMCVLLPHFALSCEVLRQPAIEGCPAIMTCTAGSQRLVFDCSPGLEGLQPGMPLQQALSRHGSVELVPADIPHYWSAFDQILDSLEGKSPLVEGSDLGHAYLGLNGLEGIYRNDEALVVAINKVIPKTFSAQFGIAEGKFPAYLAALQCPPGGCRTLTGDITAFLKDLSCDVLPVSLKSRDRLHDFGIDTLGQVAALAPGPLLSQFGPEGKRIWDLARGHDDTPLYPRFSEQVIEESATLPSMTVSLEAILVVVESLLARAFARDGLKGKGVRRLILWATIWGSGYWERSIRFKEPAMDARNALSRIKQVMESYPPPGPVEEAGIRITGLGRRPGRQGSLFYEVRARDHLLEDIKQLELRLGSPQVFRIREVEPWSRIPERRLALTPVNR